MVVMYVSMSHTRKLRVAHDDVFRLLIKETRWCLETLYHIM